MSNRLQILEELSCLGNQLDIVEDNVILTPIFQNLNPSGKTAYFSYRSIYNGIRGRLDIEVQDLDELADVKIKILDIKGKLKPKTYDIIGSHEELPGIIKRTIPSALKEYYR